MHALSARIALALLLLAPLTAAVRADEPAPPAAVPAAPPGAAAPAVQPPTTGAAPAPEPTTGSATTTGGSRDTNPGNAPATSPARASYRIARTSADIHVDGRLDEAPWQQPPTLTLDYEVRPGDNTPPQAKTDLWITYDQRNVYIAVRAHDPQPGKIRAHLRDRDNAFSDDFVGVALDTFNDERRASEFFVNPLGVQMDSSMNDVTGNEDSSWDTLWASAGRITSDGYEVEMAIPFSSLRFPKSGGNEQTWGIDAVRAWPRDQSYLLASNPRPRGRNCYLCGEGKLTGFGGVTPGRNIEIDPTVTANRTESRDDTSGPFASDSKVDPGITARWGITPGMTLNATLNPDFSQVEADAAQLNVNTNFALFFPEKRPFFLEGADLFDTKINAMYTRNIADPSWGLKVAGKQGSYALGVIVAKDTLTNLLFPGPQGSQLGTLDEDNTSTMVHYRRDLASGSGSALGGIFTSRDGTDYHNHLVGFDSITRRGEDALRVELLGSDTRYPLAIAQQFGQPSDDMRGGAARIVYQHTTRDWMGFVEYYEVTKDFRADLGFIPQADVRKNYNIYERYLYSDEGKTWWNRLTLGTESTFTYDHAGDPLQRQVSPYVGVNGPRQSFVNVYVGTGDSFFGTRSFDRNFVDAYAEVQALPSVFATFETRLGQEIDYDNARQGHIMRFIPTVRWDAGRHLRLNLNHTYEQLDVRGGRLYTANLTDFRATYQINVRCFVRVVTQYFDLDRVPSLYTFTTAQRSRNLFDQLLFSYKVNPQTVLFLGYSDTFGGTPLPANDLAQTGRTLFFKVGYAFVM